LLIPGERLLTQEARLRLQVLQELDDLGGGFKIAAHDLEIRGAGNLLGKQQSGHITAVGFELYTQMMEQAVQELRGEPPSEEIEPELHLGIPAYIPDSYIDDVNQRLTWYKRLAALKRPEDREPILDELSDRYGPVPRIVHTLIDVMDVRRRLAALRITEARIRGPRLALRIHTSSPPAGEAVVELGRSQGRQYALTPDGTLTVPVETGSEERTLASVCDVLALLEAQAERAHERASASRAPGAVS